MRLIFQEVSFIKRRGREHMMDDNVCITILNNVEGKVDIGISIKEMAVQRLETYKKLRG